MYTSSEATLRPDTHTHTDRQTHRHNLFIKWFGWSFFRIIIKNENYYGREVVYFFH